MLSITLDPESFEPIVSAIAAEVIAQCRADEARIGVALAFDEPTAARMLGLESHQLRDERLRGRIAASQIVGRRIRYVRDDLLAYLARHRVASVPVQREG